MSGLVSLSLYRFMQISLSRLNHPLRSLTVTSCFSSSLYKRFLQTKPHPQILYNIKLCFSILIQASLSRLNHIPRFLTVSGCFHHTYICFALQNNRPPQVSFSIKLFSSSLHRLNSLYYTTSSRYLQYQELCFSILIQVSLSRLNHPLRSRAVSDYVSPSLYRFHSLD